jgi:Zn-dependent peptidase ImmA (M78 family)
MRIDDEMIGARLQAARRALGLTQGDVGQRMGMVTSTISAIEAGKRAVTGAELYAFAQIYARPAAYFLGDESRQDSSSFEYLFRAAAEKSIERGQLVELERLVDDYDLLEGLVGAPRLPLPPDYSDFGFQSDQDAETLAEMERARLGLGDAPIADLMDLLDGSAGIRSFLIPVERDAWSSVAVLSRRGRPCIAVNAREPVYRRQYDLAHEYAHVLVHLPRKDGPPAHIDVSTPGGRASAEERFANAFASAFLLPRRAVLGRLALVLKAEAGRVTDFDLLHLALHFGVSVQAMAHRLVALRKVSRDAAQPSLTDDSRELQVLATVLGCNVEDPDGFRERPAILPTRYRYLAMKAYEDEEISLAKLAELLREPYHDLRSKVEPVVGSRVGTLV